MKIGDEVYNVINHQKATVIDIDGPIFQLYGSRETGEDPSYYEAYMSDVIPYSEGFGIDYSSTSGSRRVSKARPPVQKSRPCRRLPELQMDLPDRFVEQSRPICVVGNVSTQGINVSNNNKNIKEKKGRFNMNIKNLFGGFGKVENKEVVLTLDGKIAVKRSAEEYVRYDVEKSQIVNHMNLVIDSVSNFFYVLPVTTVAAGDIIKFKNAYYQVLAMTDKGEVRAINLKAGTNSTICKETNAFGINFYYKVTSLLGANGEAKEGLNPMMLMLLDKDDKFEDLLPLMMLSGQGFNGAEGFNNPLLLMSLLKEDGEDSNMKDLMMMQMLSGQGNAGQVNPMMMMMLMKGDGDSSMKDMMMMQALFGQQGVQAPQTPVVNPTPAPAPTADDKKDAAENIIGGTILDQDK